MTIGRGSRRSLVGIGAIALVSTVAGAKPKAPPAAPRAERRAPAKGERATAGARWTAATPDGMLDLAIARAKAGGDDALAGIALAASLADRAAAGRARAALDELGKGQGDLAAEARWVAAELDPSPAARPIGLVKNFAVLGPFQDTGGGLARREGPEEAGQTWGDPQASYSWGAYEVRWRAVPEAAVSARGIPLELMVHPRKESCSYLATRVSLKDKTPLVLRVAATGSVRLVWDGVDAGKSEETHDRLVFDRLGAKIDAAAGEHLLAVKVCSGALEDEGRVRVRAEDASGKPIDLATSADVRLPSGPPAGKPVIASLKTPLARAIDVGQKPTDAQALFASVVRMQAGADDERSPRAPGMLDKVANATGATADMVAMAGWISPFGASRSGWLNRAVERALAEGDLATASFAERRVVAARLSARMIDWAMAGLSREPLSKESDVEARLLRAMVKAEMGLDSLRRLALDEARALAAEAGDRASVALVQELATLESGFDRGRYADAKDRLAAIVPEARDAARVQAMSAKGAAAVKAAADDALASGGVTSDDELIAIGDALVGAGLHDEARAIYRTASVLAPNRSVVWSGLSQLLYEHGDKAPGDLALRRARELDPGEVRYRAELSYRSHAPATQSSASEEDRSADVQYLMEPSVFLAKKEQNPAKKGEIADRELHWVRAVTLHADRRISQLIHYSREVVIEPRTQEELYEPIPAEGDETEILRARVHRASGGVAFAEEQKSDGGRPSIRWPDLKTGDVVEVAIRSWTSGPVGRRGDPPYYFVDYAGAIATHPLLYNEVVVDSPIDRPLAVDVLNGKADRVADETKNGRRVVRMIWDNPPNVPDEPLAPKSSESVPTIVGSTFASWKEFREWYKAAVEGFTEPDDQVRRLAADLTKGKASRDEKVRAIFEYVADDIRYVNYVSGEWWLPNRPQQLLARRQGDCDDKAILLITLLKAVGIEATEVLIQTRYTGQPSVLLSQKAAIPLFDHGIAYLPGAGGAPGTWLDATSPQSRLGPVPSMDARTYALFATQGPPEMVRTPAGSPDEHGIDGTWTIDVGPTGAGDLDADERHVGDHAFILRSNLREKDARSQWVEQNLIAGWFPTVEVGKSVDFRTDLPKGAAEVRYKAHSDGLARREGEELVVPLAPASTMTSQLAPLVKRTLPVVLPAHMAPSHQTRTIRVVGPAGYKLADLAPGGDENGGEFGRAHLEIAKDPKNPRAAIVKRSMVFDMSTIPVAKYDAWRAWLQRVDTLMHRSVRFTRADEKPGRVAEKGAGK